MAENIFITEERIEGESDGPLADTTVAVKDNISTEGVRTTCGSAMLEEYVPPYDATVVSRLTDAGATIVGKTNMDEFGMGSTTETSAFGETDNPAAPGHVPGGSSGGSAAAVAAGEADVALGSDTGGSIRCPAAFCGVVGIKPTYGLVSRYGLVAYGNSLEQIGPFANTVEDAASLLDVIAGPDNHDATTRAPDLEGESYADAATGDVDGLQIGVPTELLEGADEGVVETFWESIAELEAQGAAYHEVSLPSVEHAVEAYYVIAMSEASSNLARFDASATGSQAATTATGTRPSPKRARRASATRSNAASSLARTHSRLATTTSTTKRPRTPARGSNRTSTRHLPRPTCSHRRRCQCHRSNSAKVWTIRSRCTWPTRTRSRSISRICPRFRCQRARLTASQLDSNSSVQPSVKSV